MIREDLLSKPYAEYKASNYIQYECDYCGKVFERDKKYRERSVAYVNKDSCGDKPCTQKKKEDVSMFRYGTKSPGQSQEVKDRIKQSNIEKFGCGSYFETDKFKEKRKETLIENFGVDSPLKSPEIRKKIEKTCLEKYGTENYFQTDEFKNKSKESSQEKYGTDSPMQHPDVLAKRDETCIEKYGVKNYTQTDEYWEKRKASSLEKYGVEHTHQLPEVQEKMKKTCLERYGFTNYAMSEESKQRYIKTCMEKYGVPNPLCLEENQVYGKAQKEIQDWLQALGLVFKSDYSVLKKKQIDLFNDDLKLGIEYCGLFWHNEVSPTPRDSRYHYRKYKACNENGVSLITIFEDEWTLNKNKCKDILKGILGIYDIRLYARKCSVSLIDKKQLRDFCEANHIQGSNKRAIVCFGLFYDQELMGVMSLGYHPRNTIKDVIVLDRMCFKNGIQVVGGASKLFKQCATWAVNNSYKSIVTWSDNRWSDGKVYDILGFDLDKKLPPDYSYVNLHNVRPGRTSKQSQRKLLTGCPKDKTEHEFALENGFARIWDCGKKRWIFNL